MSSKLFLKTATGIGFTRADPPHIRKVDITDFTTFEALINELNPSIIVHR
jgi:dTDP-4-dehydrorhamnose reductase